MSHKPRAPPSTTSSKTGAKKYKSIGAHSTVDETLFGTKKTNTFGGASAISSFAEVGAETALVSSTDLARMKAAPSIMTAEEVSNIKAELQAKKDAAREISVVRKERMLKMEEERKKKVPPTETESLKMKADGATLTKAEAMLEEELDDVKHMNQMMLYSKCVTIRDAQIEEKKHMKIESEEEERRLDLMMEIERIKALEAYEQREVRRLDDRRRGASILKRQIDERVVERQRQEELRDQDRQQMLAEIERMKEEEMVALQQKREAGRKMLEEVAEANKAQIARKKLIILAEQEEDERIAQYLREKELREQEQADIAEAMRKEKERETARLRAQQEKSQDRQAELDELRAMRAQESYEREWREKERAEQERVRAINEDLARAREQQKMVKMKQLADQARLEQEEFFRIIDAQQQKEEEDLLLKAKMVTIRTEHKGELINQIMINEERKNKERKEYLEEGERLRQQHRAEKARLDSIKHRKLVELESSGVPAKYRAELQRKKIAD